MARFPQIGIGVPFFRAFGGIDTQAQAHYDRVIADGGIMPAGLLGCNAWFVAVKAVYAVTDITTAISAGYDPHYLGAKIGAGSGTTLGQAATKLYSCSGASGDLVQATAASMPLLLVKNASDSNYWFGSGVAGNYVSTPSATANRIIGDLEIIGLTKYLSFTTQQAIISKHESGARQYSFQISAGTLRLELSADGTSITNYLGTANIPYSANTLFYAKVTRNATTGDIKFYTSLDGTTYTQLGATVSGFTGNLFNGTSEVRIGAVGNFLTPIGNVNRVTLSNTIGGTPVVDFNPASYNAANSQTSWVSASGETWTINTGTATTGYKGQIVDYTCIQGDGVDDRLSGPNTSTLSSNFSSYLIFRKFFGVSDGDIFGASGGGDSWMHFYCEANNIKRWSTGPTYIAVNTLNLMSYTGTGTGAGSVETMQKNNGSVSTINNAKISKPASEVLGVLAINGVGGFNLNAIAATLILTSTVDNSTTRTAMYNALRSFRNNAF